jgi:hypothetical protein
LELDDHNRGHIRYFREELGLKATLSAKSASKYLEIHNLKSSPKGGNVILVVPMGEEAFHSEQKFPQSSAMSTPPRHFHYQNPQSTVDLIAPNGLRVAVIEVANGTQSHIVKLGNFYASLTGLDCRNHPFAQIVGIRLPHS